MRNQLAVFWQGFTGKRPPTTYRDLVDAAGSIRRAARLAGVSPSTISNRLRKEAAAGTVKAQVAQLGGVKQAAEAAGKSPRTIRRWLKQEHDGQTPGKRQLAHMADLRKAAQKDQAAKTAKAGGAAAADPLKGKLRNAVLGDAQARQQAINGRRAARIANTGGRFQAQATVTVISTDQMEDTRERTMDVEVSGGAMRDGIQAWMGGGSATDVMGALGQGFTNNYLHSHEGAYGAGAQWRFDQFKNMTIGQHTPGAHIYGD